MHRLATAVSLDVGLLLGAGAIRFLAHTPPELDPITIDAPRSHDPLSTSVMPLPAPHYPGACTESLDFRFPTHVGADGIADSVITYTYDDRGRVAFEDWQRPDAPHRTLERTYDDAGHLAREQLRLYQGRTVRTTSYRYDRAGRRVEAAIDEDVDGRADWLELRSYDRAGRLVTLRENLDARTRRGGLTHWYDYDASGRLVLQKVDSDGNGIADHEIRSTYDDRDRVVEKRTRWYGRGDHVPIGDVFTYDHDDAGRVVAETDRHGFTWVHVYDRGGNLLVKERQMPPQITDRTPMMRITYDYGCW
jgi:YD repeat-containing protein